MSLALLQPRELEGRKPYWASPLRVSRAEVVVFTRQFAVMYRSGVPVLKTIRALAHQSEDHAMSYVLLGMAGKLKVGYSLSEAMALYPRVFGPVYLALIKEGESAGSLDLSLERACRDLEEEESLRRRVGLALHYPLFVIGTALIVGYLSLHFLKPVILELLSSGKDIPVPTQVLLAVMNVVENPWTVPAMVALLVLSIIIYKRVISTPRGRFQKDRILLKIPLLSTVIRNMVLCRVARTLGSSFRSGIPLTLALELSAEAAGNAVFQQDLRKAKSALINGVALPQFFSARGQHYTPAFCAMVSVGHETGALDVVADKLAVLLELEISQALESFLACLQPLIIVMLGIGVGAIGVAALMPLYNFL